MMQEDGLRSWLKQAADLGELRTIEGADWDLEIGGVADIVTERGSSPAVLFDSITGYPKGHRVLVNSLGSTKRLGLSLEMPEDLSALGFVSEWRKRSKALKRGTKGHPLAFSCFLLLFFALFGPLSPAEAQPLRKVHAAIPAITPAAAPFAIARDRGFYREEGLDVDLIVMPSAVGIQALIGGNVNVSTQGGAGLLPALRGAPIRLLFSAYRRPMYWLYARPEIRSVIDLRGKKVGVSSIGSGPDSLLRDILTKHGIEGGREVVILPVGSGIARFYALQARSVDAAMLSIPANFMAQDAGFRQLVSFIDQDMVELQGSILTSLQLLESDPKLVERFLRGSAKGFRILRDNRTVTIQVLTRFLKLKEDEVAKIYDVIRPGLTPDGTLSEELQKKSLEHILARVGLKEPPPLETIFDFTLARKVNDELQTRGWKP